MPSKALAKFSKEDQAYMREIYDKLMSYQQDPVGFAVDVLGMKRQYIWPKMQAVIESVRDYQKTAVPAGHSVSKTYGAGRIVVPWFKACFQPSTVVTTAPSDNQVKNQLWRHVHASYQSAKFPLGGRMNQTMWDCKPSPEVLEALEPEARELWEMNFAIGFATSADVTTEGNATKMQGWHNEWVLLVLDEACGLLGQIWRTAMEGLVVNPRCKVLAIGNPTDPECEFASACKLNGKLDHLENSSEPYMSDEGWHVVPVAVTDTPNYQQGKEVVPGLAGREYEAEILKKYRKGSDRYNVRMGKGFARTKEGTYYGKELAEARQQGRIGHFPYDPSFPVYRFADFGDIWTGCIDVQFIRQRIRIINDYWDNAGTCLAHGGTIPIESKGARGCALSMQAMGYVWGKEHFAGPDLEGSNKHSFVASGTTTRDVLRSLGFNFKAVPSGGADLGKAVSFDEGIAAVQFVWPLLDIDEKGAATFLDAVKGYGKKKNEATSTEDQPAFHNQPAATWHRHLADALRHLAIQYRYGTIDGVYIGESKTIAAYHHQGAQPRKPINPLDWMRRQR